LNGFPSHWQVSRAARCIHSGGIVAYPTEAVFGLGCDPANPRAVMRLLALKQRQPEKGLILVAASLQQLQPWVAPLPKSPPRIELARPVYLAVARHRALSGLADWWSRYARRTRQCSPGRATPVQGHGWRHRVHQRQP